MPRPASIRTLDRTPKSAKKIERSKPGEAFTSLFAGGSSKKATLLRFFVFFRFVFRGAPVPRSLSRLREGRGEGAEMCSLEKVGRFLENREKEERREGKSRWHSFSTRHRFSFAPLDLDLNLDLRPRRRKGKLTLSISPPLFFYNPRLLFLPPSFPHPQLLIKGIRSFSPDNEVKMGSFWVLFLSLSSLPFSGSFRSLPTTNSNQKNISKKKKKKLPTGRHHFLQAPHVDRGQQRRREDGEQKKKGREKKKRAKIEGDGASEEEQRRSFRRFVLFLLTLSTSF